MFIREKIIETIKSSINLICKCDKEKQIQDIIGAQLDSKVRHTLISPLYPNVEIDVFGDNFAIEVKLEEKYYSGIIQVLTLKILHKIEDVTLFHVNSFLDEKFISAIKEFSQRLGFMGILLHKREKSLEVIY